MLFSVKADAFGSAAKQFKQHGGSFPVTIKTKPHGCAMRRGRGGDRKAPSPLPQERNPCEPKAQIQNNDTTAAKVLPFLKDKLSRLNQKNHKKMTIRCNEIAFSFV